MEHQKTAEGTGDWISSKTADVVRSEILAARAKSYNSKFINVSKIHNKIIQRQLEMRMIKKYLKKYLYLQKKNRKLEII